MPNQITLPFTLCSPPPANGYIVKYRPAGSSIAYRVVTGVTASPFVITDSNDADGTNYVGVIQSDCGDGNFGTEKPFTANIEGLACGDTYTSNYDGIGLYTYPSKLIDLHEGTVNINWSVYDRPNTFTIYKDGLSLVTTGWKGIATYSGPWGSSISTATTGVLTYMPEVGHIYTLVVQAGPTDHTAPITDSFNVAIDCTPPAETPDATIIAGTIAKYCSDEGCTNQGLVSLTFTFPTPTPAALQFYIGHIYAYYAGLMYQGDSLFAPPAGSTFDPYYDIDPYSMGVTHATPFYVNIPAGVTSYTVAEPIYQVTYLGGIYGRWTCHNCQTPIRDIYIKLNSPATGYTINFTSATSGVTIHNV